MVFTGAIKLRAARWYLSRKLSRRTRADFAVVAGKVIAIRLYAAAACFISMLLLAWAGAFAGAVGAHGWRAFRTLDGTTLVTASTQAARYQAGLLPVLLSWAVLLLLTPTGYTIAFRMAAVAAGILGYLRFSPPSFLVTTKVAAMSHWLVRVGGRGGVLYLVVALATAYVLLSGAVGVFGRLDHLRRRVRRAPYAGPPSDDPISKLCAAALILLVLLAVTWAATVIRLAASGADRPGAGISYGLQGAVYQSKYLIVLILIAVAVSRLAAPGTWLIVAVAVTTWYSLAPGTLPLPPALEISVGRGQLIHIGTAWGADTLWAALFVFIPAAVLGMYLVGRVLTQQPFLRIDLRNVR